MYQSWADQVNQHGSHTVILRVAKEQFHTFNIRRA